MMELVYISNYEGGLIRGRRHRFVNWNPCKDTHMSEGSCQSNQIEKKIEEKSGLEGVDIAKEAHVI